MSEQEQQWEIVNGVWKEMTPKTVVRTEFISRGEGSGFGLAPVKLEGAPIIYSNPSSPSDNELPYMMQTPEGCSVVFSHGPQDLDHWFDRLVGERPEDVYRRMQEWLGENAIQEMMFNGGPRCPSGEHYQKYGLAIRVSHEAHQDHGDKLADVIRLFFALCAEKTLMSLVRRECIGDKMIYWRKPLTFHRWDDPEHLSVNVAISMRLAFGYPVPEKVG